MDYTKLGNTNLKVSRLCLGAMGFGDKSWREWVLDLADSRAIVKAAFGQGINFIDTCDFYSAGESERILGQVLQGTVPRDEIVLATKVGNPMGRHANARGFSRKHIFEAVDASLARLKTDYIDLYQTHIWQPDTCIEEMIDAFADLVRQGKVLYVGATTMPAWCFAEALSLARSKNLPGFVSMQCEYNPAHREAERELLPLCRSKGVGQIPFSPMARGFLCEDRRKESTETSRTASDDYTKKHYYREADFRVFEALSRVAEAQGISAAQAALAWVLKQPGIDSPVFGATKLEHVEEAVAALALDLPEEAFSEVESAYQARPLTSGGH